MGAFHIKSLLLGIGIGIIITATASIIFLSGRDPAKDLTKQQIISLAEQYGMVRADVLHGDDNKDNSAEIATDGSIKSTPEEETSIFKAPTQGTK